MRNMRSVLEKLSRSRDAKNGVETLQATLNKVKARPESNIPPHYQDFRALLAEHLALADNDLPYVAELVEVKTDERVWRGAIERAVGPDRLRMLVPKQHIRGALKWVNERDNRLHVRLQEADMVAPQAKFFDDGFTRKLNFKAHPLREAAKVLLASRDRHCVASAQDLQTTEHAMTAQGLMSGRAGRFDKQDQRPLHEGWVTGFDNKDQLRDLAQQLAEQNKQVDDWHKSAQTSTRELAEKEGRLTLIDQIVELDFASVDVTGAQATLETDRERLSTLLAQDSDTAKAKAKFDREREREQLKAIREQVSQLQQVVAVKEQQRADAERNRDKAAQRAGGGLSEQDLALAEKHLRLDSKLAASELEDAEREARHKTDNRLSAVQGRVSELETEIVRRMERAQRVDTGALAETGTELHDVPDYLDRLRVLTEEALPQKQSRFLDYLNRSSDQGVTQLLAGISEEVDRIEQRIAELNLTLTKVDFRNGRYLQLQPQRIRHERIRALETAQRHLRSAAQRSAALKEDNGESHYKALRAVVEILRDAGNNRRRQLGSRALLDPPYRLQFFVVEVDRSSGGRSAPRTGSQSGSGGEKELMASHILTASLSYALCPVEATRPLYGTVVLDEAFSKSSPSAATRIIEALRIFGLHPIFVTPNKELGLLKKHTRNVICVQRPGKQASLASISWEKLDELARDNR